MEKVGLIRRSNKKGKGKRRNIENTFPNLCYFFVLIIAITTFFIEFLCLFFYLYCSFLSSIPRTWIRNVKLHWTYYGTINPKSLFKSLKYLHPISIIFITAKVHYLWIKPRPNHVGQSSPIHNKHLCIFVMLWLSTEVY